MRTAASLGAAAVWSRAAGVPSRISWHERRDIFSEGVASGEMAEDPLFERVIAVTHAPISAESDWTCRVLVGGLRPSTVYWYRFTDTQGQGSRIGRTITAPAEDDARPVRFAFISCQNANQGAQNAYRRMIFEDERSPERDQLRFVLHLGDFIYEIVWYPEDRPQGMYDRRLRDIVRYEHGEKIDDFHVPTTVGDYRAIYRAYLHDPDLQDARARWPFVNMWDNHEFSWLGWQSLQKFDGKTRAAQTRKVAANQAFFEYQPARMARPGGLSLERFDPPRPSALRSSPVRFPRREWSKRLSMDFPRGILCGLSFSDRGGRTTSLSPRSTCYCARACDPAWNTPGAVILRKRAPYQTPDLSPHLSFVDMGGHGYSVVRITSSTFETEFVCIPRPLERSDRPDGRPAPLSRPFPNQPVGRLAHFC